MFGNSRGQGVRSRALMLGLPAVLVAVIGVALICTAEFGVAKNLEERYLSEAEKSTKEKRRLVDELRRELRIRRVAAPSSAQRGEQLIPEDDQRRIDLKANQKKETVYLEKLISLNNEEPEYKYKLALACLEKEESRERGLALMRKIAPSSEPGHVMGHLFLANHYLKSRTNNMIEARKNVGLGLEHVDLCLRRDKSNVPAMQYKAKILHLQRNYRESYEVYSRLFKTDPRYFEVLVELNEKLNKKERNTEVLSIAIDAYDRILADKDNLTDADRVRVFQELTKCYLARRDFPGIQEKLLKEIDFHSSSPDDLGQRVWAEHLLSSVYANWLQMFPNDLVNQLALLKKAYQYNESNEFILRRLTRLGGAKNEKLAAAARSIYDATKVKDAPALVLNELGAQALERSEHEEALRLFELARKKRPRAAEVLNNLSFAYLIGDTPNPKRALKLVDEALKHLPNTPSYKNYRTHFHDTRGKALMQLGQVSEAAAEFEFALQSRPDNVEILESLIECYRANDMDAGPYERHLSKVQSKQNGSGEGEQ